MYVYICSVRLAAAAGAGDHAGLKDEGKRDVITGRTPSYKYIKFIFFWNVVRFFSFSF